LRTACLVSAALVLAGCTLSTHFVYVRADGQDMTANPALYDQYEADRAICQGQTVSGNLQPLGFGGYSGSTAGNDIFQDCMAKHGYTVMSAEAAAAKQQEMAAAAAEKARREAEAAAPPPPPPARRVATKPKPKPKPPQSVQTTPQPGQTSPN